jgi:LuxR family maltose regulon positive regulatory protein
MYKESFRQAEKLKENIDQAVGDLHLGTSKLLYEKNDLDSAEQHFLISKELFERFSYPSYRLLVVEYRLKAARGDLKGALETLEEAERVHRRTPLPELKPISALKARVFLRMGKLEEVHRWVLEQGLSVSDELSYLHEYEHITLVRVLIATYQRKGENQRIDDALNLLGRLMTAAEEGGRMGVVLEIMILKALALQSKGSHSEALEALERALKFAEPEGYIRTFVDEGKPMAELLSKAVVDGIYPEYSGKLLQHLKKELP